VIKFIWISSVDVSCYIYVAVNEGNRENR